MIFSHIIQFWVNPSAVSGVPNQTQRRPTKIKKDQFHGRPNPMSPFSPNKWVTIPQFLLSMLKINPNQSNSLPIYGPSQSSWECPLVSKTKDSVHWVSFVFSILTLPENFITNFISLIFFQFSVIKFLFWVIEWNYKNFRIQ